MPSSHEIEEGPKKAMVKRAIFQAQFRSAMTRWRREIHHWPWESLPSDLAQDPTKKAGKPCFPIQWPNDPMTYVGMDQNQVANLLWVPWTVGVWLSLGKNPWVFSKLRDVYYASFN